MTGAGGTTTSSAGMSGDKKSDSGRSKYSDEDKMKRNKAGAKGKDSQGAPPVKSPPGKTPPPKKGKK